MAQGAVLPLTQVWALAQAWYGSRLDAGYSGRSAGDVESILAGVGLNGPFWRFAS